MHADDELVRQTIVNAVIGSIKKMGELNPAPDLA